MVAHDYRLQLAGQRLPPPACGFKTTLSRQLSLLNAASVTMATTNKGLTVPTKDQCILHLLMGGNAGIAVSRTSGDIVKILKCPADFPLIGKKFIDFIHCEDKSLVSASVRRLRHGEKTVRFECRFVNLKRNVIWLEAVISRSRLVSGGLEVVLQNSKEDLAPSTDKSQADGEDDNGDDTDLDEDTNSDAFLFGPPGE